MNCNSCPLAKTEYNRLKCRILDVYMANDDECSFTDEELDKKHEKIKKDYKQIAEDKEEMFWLMVDLGSYLKRRNNDE